ncbi:MAG: hypothetical protein NTU49_03335 [Gammaproteobacteria bacterium]|nr:hypothetical protein [Gammaproteobacteria bacterium]
MPIEQLPDLVTKPAENSAEYDLSPEEIDRLNRIFILPVYAAKKAEAEALKKQHLKAPNDEASVRRKRSSGLARDLPRAEIYSHLHKQTSVDFFKARQDEKDPEEITAEWVATSYGLDPTTDKKKTEDIKYLHDQNTGENLIDLICKSIFKDFLSKLEAKKGEIFSIHFDYGEPRQEFLKQTENDLVDKYLIKTTRPIGFSLIFSDESAAELDLPECFLGNVIFTSELMTDRADEKPDGFYLTKVSYDHPAIGKILRGEKFTETEFSALILEAVEKKVENSEKKFEQREEILAATKWKLTSLNSITEKPHVKINLKKMPDNIFDPKVAFISDNMELKGVKPKNIMWENEGFTYNIAGASLSVPPALFLKRFEDLYLLICDSEPKSLLKSFFSYRWAINVLKDDSLSDSQKVFSLIKHLQKEPGSRTAKAVMQTYYSLYNQVQVERVSEHEKNETLKVLEKHFGLKNLTIARAKMDKEALSFSQSMLLFQKMSAVQLKNIKMNGINSFENDINLKELEKLCKMIRDKTLLLTEQNIMPLLKFIGEQARKLDVNADLTGVDFSNKNLMRVDHDKKIIMGVNFSNFTLHDCIFENTSLAAMIVNARTSFKGCKEPDKINVDPSGPFFYEASCDEEKGLTKKIKIDPKCFLEAIKNYISYELLCSSFNKNSAKRKNTIFLIKYIEEIERKIKIDFELRVNKGFSEPTENTANQNMKLAFEEIASQYIGVNVVVYILSFCETKLQLDYPLLHAFNNQGVFDSDIVKSDVMAKEWMSNHHFKVEDLEPLEKNVEVNVSENAVEEKGIEDEPTEIKDATEIVVSRVENPIVPRVELDEIISLVKTEKTIDFSHLTNFPENNEFNIDFSDFIFTGKAFSVISAPRATEAEKEDGLNKSVFSLKGEGKLGGGNDTKQLIEETFVFSGADFTSANFTDQYPLLARIIEIYPDVKISEAQKNAMMQDFKKNKERYKIIIKEEKTKEETKETLKNFQAIKAHILPEEKIETVTANIRNINFTECWGFIALSEKPDLKGVIITGTAIPAVGFSAVDVKNIKIEEHVNFTGANLTKVAFENQYPLLARIIEKYPTILISEAQKKEMLNHAHEHPNDYLELTKFKTIQPQVTVTAAGNTNALTAAPKSKKSDASAEYDPLVMEDPFPKNNSN